MDIGQCGWSDFEQRMQMNVQQSWYNFWTNRPLLNDNPLLGPPTLSLLIRRDVFRLDVLT